MGRCQYPRQCNQFKHASLFAHWLYALLQNGLTALHMASNNNHHHAASVLLADTRTDVNVQDQVRKQATYLDCFDWALLFRQGLRTALHVRPYFSHEIAFVASQSPTKSCRSGSIASSPLFIGFLWRM